MNRHRLMLTIIISATVAFIAGCTAAPAQPNKKTDNKGVMTQRQVLTIAETQPLDTVDISKATGFGKLANSTEGLYRQGESGSIEPGLASHTVISDNGRKYIFTIRPDAKWSDGSAITANDFMYSWRRTLNTETNSTYTDLFVGIKNALKIAHHQLPSNQLGVKAIDRRTLEVTLDHPMTYFRSLMAYPLFAPQKEAVVNKFGSHFATSATTQVYSGPFELIKWHKGSTTRTLKPNPYYWDREHVYLSKLNIRTISNPSASFRAYQNKQLDSTQLLSQQIKNSSRRLDYSVMPYSMMVYLAYNFQDNTTKRQHQLLKNRNFRLAVSHAINRKALIYKGLKNASLPPKGFVTTGISKDSKSDADFANMQQGTKYTTGSVKQAKAEWQTAKRQLNINSAKIKIVVDDSTTNRNLARCLKSQLETKLADLSVSFVFKQSNAATAAAFKTGKFDLMIAGWGADFSDPVSFLQIMTNRNPYNYGHWQNKTYDRLTFAAIRNSHNDDNQRWQQMLDAEELLMKDQAVTPLYQQVRSYLVNPSLNGVIYNSTGVSADYKRAYFIK
ncbi:ABC transporter substrate-binding protein [Secundilactobacillus oryzae]|nr:ABC transporter substrate-binding protein [Secundilactobacillus oryzae]